LRRPLALAAFLALLLCLGLFFPVWQGVVHVLQAVRDAGPAGALLYTAAFVPAALLLLPSAPLALGAGHAFGAIEGTMIAAVGTSLGATAAFEVGRRVGGDSVRRMLARSRRLSPFTRALENAGFEVVLWLRLSPLVPFYLLNYAFGTTGLRARDYAVATILALVPGCGMYALLGSLLPSPLEGGAAGPPAYRWGAAAVALALSLFAAAAARARLPRLLARSPGNFALPANPDQAGPPGE
jgi:uncharacterized membrane protein YdjX (TVP38/TMEM64 family)